MMLIIMILLIVSAPFASGQEILTTVETPSIQGEEPIPGLQVSELNHDFGAIYFGEPVTHTFRIVNTSSAPVSILNLRSDCGCTSKLSSEVAIEPAGSVDLNITYEPEFRVGKINKRITVYTDIPEENRPGKWFELHLTGTIESTLNLVPGHVYFKKVYAGENAEEKVQITRNNDSSVEIKEVKSSSSHLKTELVDNRTGTKPSDSWTLNLTLSDTAPAGRFEETVTLVTTSEKQPRINLDVLGFVRGQVSVRPTQSYLGTLVAGENVEKEFVVSCRGEPGDLREPLIKDPPSWMTYTVETETENKRYKIKVTIKVPENHEGRFGGTFTIDIGHSSLKEFEIPVFGYVLPPNMIAEEPAAKKQPESTTEEPQP